MRKYLMILVALIGFLGVFNSVSAQTRTKIADGLYLVRYGNTAVIEDDIHQISLNLKVTKHQANTGAEVYDFLCGNKYTKDLTKQGLQDAIAAGLTYLGGSVGAQAAGIGAAPGAAAGAFISKYANKIAMNFYDDVCNYFSK